MKATTVAVDLAKHVFEFAISLRDGEVYERKRFSRTAFALYLNPFLAAPDSVGNLTTPRFSRRAQRRPPQSIGQSRTGACVGCRAQFPRGAAYRQPPPVAAMELLLFALTIMFCHSTQITSGVRCPTPRPLQLAPGGHRAQCLDQFLPVRRCAPGPMA